MAMPITRISVDNPVFATMLMVALMVFGLFSYRQRAAQREMLQHLQRAARHRQLRATDPIGPVVAAVDLRKEPRHSPRRRDRGQLG